jgi:hypothetical protein
MFAQTPAQPGILRDQPPTPATPPFSLGTFQSVRTRFIRSMLQILPWIILVVVIIAFEASDLIFLAAPTSTAGIFMYITGMLSVALCLLAFQILMQKIPEILATLWNRSIIESRSAPPSPAVLNEYQDFCRQVEASLNHHAQWVLGLVFALLVMTWATRYPFPRSFSLVGFLVLVGLAIQFLIALIVGLMVWRMIVIGVQVWRLGSRFNLAPQLGHPDGCGGLEPLGNLCLWNALIVSIGGLFLGGWTILGPSSPYASVANTYAPLFAKLLVIPMLVAAVSFFLPLWSVHLAMTARRAEVQLQLDQLGSVINGLEHEMLEKVDELQADQSEKMAKKLDVMQQVYMRGNYYPVWPFNIKTLLKFGTSQVVPLLGLTGLGEPIVKVIKALFDFLNQK